MNPSLKFWPDDAHILKQKCRPVTEEELLKGEVEGITFVDLLREMHKIMKEKKGVGLAAPQVGLGVRLFMAPIDGHTMKMFINPELTDLKGRHPDQEGCLSVPGRWEYVIRAEKLTINAILPDLTKFEMKVKDRFFARVMQHENDHLNGELFFEKCAMWKANI